MKIAITCMTKKSIVINTSKKMGTNIRTRTYNVNVDLPLPYFGEFVHKGRTIRNNRTGGVTIPQNNSCKGNLSKKILRIVISKKKFLRRKRSN